MVRIPFTIKGTFYHSRYYLRKPLIMTQSKIFMDCPRPHLKTSSQAELVTNFVLILNWCSYLLFDPNPSSFSNLLVSVALHFGVPKHSLSFGNHSDPYVTFRSSPRYTNPPGPDTQTEQLLEPETVFRHLSDPTSNMIVITRPI